MNKNCSPVPQTRTTRRGVHCLAWFRSLPVLWLIAGCLLAGCVAPSRQAGEELEESSQITASAAPHKLSVAESMVIQARAPRYRTGADPQSLQLTNRSRSLPKIKLSEDGRSLVSSPENQFIPFGLTYYRPGTGWAPQVWKKFDPAATRRDFARLKELGVNCARVFLSFGSFYSKPGVLDPDGLAKFDEFLTIAEQAGIYVHPTGPDHWEGLPEWAQTDRYADEKVLTALEDFWRLFASRYRGRNVILAYDLLNEPEVPWDTPALRNGWPKWLQQKYSGLDAVGRAWGVAAPGSWESIGIPAGQDQAGDRRLLDYQLYRESIAEHWVRRQAQAIRFADPGALVTAGLIQWSVPSNLAHPRHYSAFRPSRVSTYLDFMEIHFYPLDSGAYDYRDAEAEQRNLAYLEGVLLEVAREGKPVVVAEFGWYGGGRPRFDQGRHPEASEEQQARWCRRLIEVSDGLAVGWLNWGLYDQPEASDASEFTGLLAADGRVKAWGREFQQLAVRLNGRKISQQSGRPGRPALPWELCVTSAAEGRSFRAAYYAAFLKAQPLR